MTEILQLKRKIFLVSLNIILSDLSTHLNDRIIQFGCLNTLYKVNLYTICLKETKYHLLNSVNQMSFRPPPPREK